MLCAQPDYWYLHKKNLSPYEINYNYKKALTTSDLMQGNSCKFLIKKLAETCNIKISVLRIQDVYPGSEFFPSQIQDPGSRVKKILDPHQRIQVFYPKKLFLSSRKYDPGCSS